MKRRLAALLLAVCMLAGRTPASAAETMAGGSGQAAVQASGAEPGTEEYGNGLASIRVSGDDPGAMTVEWRGSGDPDVRMQVELDGDGGTPYTYRLQDGPTRVTFTEGGGTYRVTVLQHVEGIRFRVACRAAVEVGDAGSGAFTGPTAMVRYGPDSGFAKKADELCENCKTDTDDIAKIYAFVTGHMSYDGAKAKAISDGGWTGGSVPDPDAAYESGKGVCYDIAGLMAAMLRSRGVPCKLVYGHVDGMYHAWCMVLPDRDGTAGGMALKAGEWSLLDPTLGLSSNERLAQRYAADGAYKAERTY
ncbi:transglutaminase family protein [uncultured Alistipes sp.]|jgi:hypothetical protein|uniref:transglutaminase-like domain-containing protein n=1 Tax=uncultured Alistipes sp. TaxID=538949 RepID=UPI00272B6912|nr:transglutaminase domain-containing protein [uncultured Alistipes sp.]